MSALPGGQAWYAFNVREITTTDLTPKQIHELGLSEVQRLRKEMDKVIASTGFKGSFEEFLDFLRTDPQFFFDKPEDLVAAYRDDRQAGGPRADPAVRQAAAHAVRRRSRSRPTRRSRRPRPTTRSGSLEAGRPGYYRVNTYDLKSRPKWEMEALTPARGRAGAPPADRPGAGA